MAVAAMTAPVFAQQVSYTYDEAGRLVRTDYSSGASLRYVYDAAGNLVEIVATSAGPDIAIAVGGADLVDGQPMAVGLGDSRLGSPGAGQVVTVRNDGDIDLTGLEVMPPAGFLVGEGLAATLAPGASDAFTVSLDTATAGRRSGVVSVVSNDADESPFTFPVAGTVAAAPPLRYDFGTLTSPVEPGYARVGNGTTYTPAAGYGWFSGAVAAVDRAGGEALIRDFNSTPLGTFVVDVADGTYEVTITCGGNPARGLTGRHAVDGGRPGSHPDLPCRRHRRAAHAAARRSRRRRPERGHQRAFRASCRAAPEPTAEALKRTAPVASDTVLA